MRPDDVVHRLVAQHERGAEIEGEDSLDVVRVLHVPGVVEVELALQVRLDRGRYRPLRFAERVALDLPHEEEREQDHEQQHGDRPEEPPDYELRHRLAFASGRPQGRRQAAAPPQAFTR
jgi:hypothetical protein